MDERVKDIIKTADYQRAYVMDGLRGILDLIRETCPDMVLGITKGEKGERGSGLEGIELKDWNSSWVEKSRAMVDKLWDTGIIMATDISAIAKGLTNEPKGKSP